MNCNDKLRLGLDDLYMVYRVLVVLLAVIRYMDS